MNQEEAVYCVLLSQEERESVQIELEAIRMSIKAGLEVDWLQTGDERPVENITAAEQNPDYRADDGEDDESDENKKEKQVFMVSMSSSLGSKLAAYNPNMHFGLLFLDWYESSWLIRILQIAVETCSMKKADPTMYSDKTSQRQSMLAGISGDVYFASNLASVRSKLVEAFAHGA